MMFTLSFLQSHLNRENDPKASHHTVSNVTPPRVSFLSAGPAATEHPGISELVSLFADWRLSVQCRGPTVAFPLKL